MEPKYAMTLVGVLIALLGWLGTVVVGNTMENTRAVSAVNKRIYTVEERQTVYLVEIKRSIDRLDDRLLRLESLFMSEPVLRPNENPTVWPQTP